MAGNTTALRTLPLVARNGSGARLTDAEMMRFESILDATDSAVEACMLSRTNVRLPCSDDSLVGVTWALVKTVSAMTGTAEPGSIESKRVVVAWAHAALSAKSERDTMMAMDNHTRVDPKIVDLIAQIGQLTGGSHGYDE